MYTLYVGAKKMAFSAVRVPSTSFSVFTHWSFEDMFIIDNNNVYAEIIECMLISGVYYGRDNEIIEYTTVCYPHACCVVSWVGQQRSIEYKHYEYQTNKDRVGKKVYHHIQLGTISPEGMDKYGPCPFFDDFLRRA